MKGNTMLLSQSMSVILLVTIIGVVFQPSPSVFGQELSAAQKAVWETVESYWNTWKEKTSGELRPFYHKNYVHWGATYTWPFSSATMDPPPGYLDGVGDVIDSYELTFHDVRVWNNVAVAMYESKVTYLGGAHRLRCSDIWIKEGDKWLIIGSIRDSCSTLPNCQSSAIESTEINQRYEELYPVGRSYGQRGLPYGDGRHPGIDYLTPIGTPVVAVSDGTIDFIGEALKDKIYGGGFAVRLKHADDFFSVYIHLSDVHVTIAQRIKRGGRIGLSGQSNDGSPHLHFGLIKNVEVVTRYLFPAGQGSTESRFSENPLCHRFSGDGNQMRQFFSWL